MIWVIVDRLNKSAHFLAYKMCLSIWPFEDPQKPTKARTFLSCPKARDKGRAWFWKASNPEGWAKAILNPIRPFVNQYIIFVRMRGCALVFNNTLSDLSNEVFVFDFFTLIYIWKWIPTYILLFKWPSFLLRFLRTKHVHHNGHMEIRIIDGMRLYVYIECEYIGNNRFKWA